MFYNGGNTMSQQMVGSTHAAHETRHLARKMQEVRNGKKTKSEISDLISKIEEERKKLSERYGDCSSYLEIQSDLQMDIPELTAAEAKKHTYVDGLETMDFLFIQKLETHYLYDTEPPRNEHLHTGMMLLKACINDLTWALAELKAYEKE